MNHENIKTTTVRMATATFESVFLIPHFASTDVMPAKNAEAAANAIHIVSTPFYIRPVSSSSCSV